MSNNEEYREAYDMLCEFSGSDVHNFVRLQDWILSSPAVVVPSRIEKLSEWLLDNKGLKVNHKGYIFLQDLQKAIDDQKVPVYNPVKNISRSKYNRCMKTCTRYADLYRSGKSGCVWMYKSTCNKYYYWADYNAKNEVIYFRGEVDWVKSNYEPYEAKVTTACADIIMDMENWHPLKNDDYVPPLKYAYRPCVSFSVAEDAFDNKDYWERIKSSEGIHASLGIAAGAGELIAPKNDDFIDFSDHNEFIKDVPAVKRLPVKSDGGKSSYYEVNCPQWFIDKVNNGSFMVEDLAEIMYGNDFNYTNILKAQKRMYEMENGSGKEGNTLEYDATKCKYYVDKQLEIAKRGV